MGLGVSTKNVTELVMRSSEIIADLRSRGLRVEIGSDFSRYRKLRCQARPEKPIYPMFDVSSSFIDSTNGLWIVGFNENNVVVHTQAARLLKLKGVLLNEHLNEHRYKYITPNTTPDPDLTFYEGPTGLSKVTGQVSYNGDFWLAPRGMTAFGGVGATQRLTRLVFDLLFCAWTPDYSFAFLPKELADKGLHVHYGYTNCEPGRWIGPDAQVTEEEYLAWMSANDIQNMLSRPIGRSRRPAKMSKSTMSVVK